MQSVNMSTERLRFLLREIREKDQDYTLCVARDIYGPGGGVYITADSALEEKHLTWLERRNPAPEGDTFVEVILYKGKPSGGRTAASPAVEMDLPEEKDTGEESYRDRAEKRSAEVGKRAKAVARQAEKMYRTIGKADFSIADLRRAEVEGGLKEFEKQIRIFHGAVKKAIEEYMRGNTLVMDLIVKFQLDKKAVRHALNVAAFATEITAQLALKGSDGSDLEEYFEGMSREELPAKSGEGADENGEITPEELEIRRQELFKDELVEIFLGGFMHDCGLWNEPFCLDEGHEIKGAKLIWELQELQEFAPSLVKIILFHSDIVRLSDRYGVVKVIEAPDDPERISFKREFFHTDEDAHTAIEMRPGNFMASILQAGDLRKVVPVALAERYITQTQDIDSKSRREVINDLARYVKGGLFLRYVVALCNAQVEVIAPRRAYVKLDGRVTVTVDDKREGRRAQRLDVTDFEAASIHHGKDRNSPHLISLFIRRPDGSRDKAEYVGPQDPGFWERVTGVKERMYLPVGRFRNNLSLQVTGFISEDVYGKILEEYERELKLRMNY